MTTKIRNGKTRWLVVGVALLGLMAAGSSRLRTFVGAPVTVSAAGPFGVVAVPWAGLEANDHEVYSGGSVMLQAVASNGGDGNAVALCDAFWDPGDGAGFVAVPFANSRALELAHTYAGADGTPFTATVKTSTNCSTYVMDTFRVRIKPKSLGTEVNMAIDKALWANHKAMGLSTSGAFTVGSWCDNNCNANTASAVQAFEINGHRETGDPTKDPYADDVGRGLRFLQDHVTRFAISPTSTTSYVASGVLGAPVAVNQADLACGTTPTTDVVSAGLSITRGCTNALSAGGGDATLWSDGSCAAPSSNFYSSHTALLQNVIRLKSGGVPSALPGSTECLIDTTTSAGYDLVFGSPWGVNPSGEFHYTRRQWTTVTPTVITLNPDGNANGYGLNGDPNGGEPVYVGGQVIDAFVAAGTQTTVAVVGTEVGRTYKNIVQDLQDGYSGSQDPSSGGWIYSLAPSGGIDSSSTGWWGVGTLAGDIWGNTVDPLVRQSNFTKGVKGILQSYDGTGTGNDGSCGYRSAGGNAAETGSCLIQMNADLVPRTDPRYVASEQWIKRQWPNGDTRNSLYTMYNVTKAMRTAVGGAVTLLGGTIDWYAADANPAVPADPGNGYARMLVGTQGADGRLAQYCAGGCTVNSDGWTSGSLSNSWGILILSAGLFEQGPTAACSVNSSIVCQANQISPCNPTGANPYAAVELDGSASTPGDNPIASYSWNFQDGPPTEDATTPMTTASFASTGTFNIALTVTDTKGHSSTVTCPVQVVNTALPPVADAGGPYSLCPGGMVELDGRGSFGRGSNIISYEWDWTNPVNFTPADSTLDHTDQTAFFAALAPGAYNVGLRVKDDSTPQQSSTSFTTVTVRTAGDPACAPTNQPPVCSAATASLNRPLFPLDALMRAVTIGGLTDPNGDPIGVNIDAVCQDEKPNDAPSLPLVTIDGAGVSTGSAGIRAERTGGTRTAPGNGRAYHVFFTANDGKGGMCEGEVKIGVPMTPTSGPAMDDGALLDSTKSTNVACGVGVATLTKK